MNRWTMAALAVPLLLAAGCEGMVEPAEGQPGPKQVEAPPVQAGPAGVMARSEDGTPVLLNPNRRAVLDEPLEVGLLALGTSQDASKKITMQMWECRSPGISVQPNPVACQVASDYVLVGGGAWAEWFSSGALLTASFPSDANLTTWEARSKDHGQGLIDQHVLHTFAIGIKLSGVSRATLLSNMIRVSNTSSQAPHPFSQADLPSAYRIVGGGAKTNYTGAGSMLIMTSPWVCFDNFGNPTPDCHSWAAMSKDHQTPDPATITAYAIGIKPTIAGFGTLKFSAPYQEASQVSTGVASVNMRVTSGSVITSYGAGDTNQPFGRFPFRIGPSDGFPNDEALIQSKDHIYANPSSLHGRIVQISL